MGNSALQLIPRASGDEGQTDQTTRHSNDRRRAARRALTRALTNNAADLAPLTLRLEPRDFALNIAAKGELQSAEALTIAVPPVPAQRLRIASVVPEGRAVNKGDLLVEFDPTELDLQALEHTSSLEAANQKISKGELARGVEQTDIVKDKKIAEMELEKISEFLPQDEQIYSRRQIIEGQLDKGYAEKRIVFADARMSLKGKVYSLDEAILMLEKQKATQSLNQAKTALSSLKLLSPSAGVIAPNEQGFWFGGAYPMPGRVVWIGTKLFSLVNPDRMEAKVFVLEKDAGELRAEQPVTVTLDPFPHVAFTGKVKSIEKVARPLERDSPVKYFQAVVSLDKTDAQLMRPGVKLKATVRASDLKAAIVVPRSAVVQKDAGFVAFVERGAGQFEPVAVKLGAGAERESLQLIDAMGLRNIIVRDREFKDEDLKKIRENSLGLSLRDVEAINAVTPDIESYSARKRVKTYQVFSFRGKSDDSNVVGVTPSHFRLAKYELAEGSLFAEPDEREYEQYCVIGSRVKQKLFGHLSPVGQAVKINNLWFTVIGVLADYNLAKDEFEGVKIQDFSNDIYLPLATALKKFEPKRFESELDEVVISLKNTEAIKPSSLLISQVLAGTHGKADDYSILVPRELLEQNQQTQRIFNIVMICIASISLLVGGIGIMNIMLANILERTREIGVRRAIGARRRDIWQQFLIEALTISFIGGLTGVLFGFGVSKAVALYAGWNTLVTTASIATSFGVSAAVGLLFGIYPAVRASRLDPVEALRYE